MSKRHRMVEQSPNNWKKRGYRTAIRPIMTNDAEALTPRTHKSYWRQYLLLINSHSD